MLIFKPEDFDDLESCSSEDIAEYCNARFRCWVKMLDVVYARTPEEPLVWVTYQKKDDIPDTHQAYIFGIKEIEAECSHEAVMIDSVDGTHYCDSCHKKLNPTGWDVVSD